jgi:hypothetical protein
LSQQTRNNLQEAIDAHIADDYGDFAMSKDWVLSAHVVSLEDINEDSGQLAIYKGEQTSVFTATGILVTANDTYRSNGYSDEIDDD